MKIVRTMVIIIMLVGLPIIARATQAIATGTVTKSNLRLNVIPDNAFLYIDGVDLSVYVGCKLILTDTGGKTITGYIKAAGAGEDLGSDIYAGLDLTSGWTTSGASINSSSSFTTSTTNGYVSKTAATLGQCYKISFSFSASKGTTSYRYASGTVVSTSGATTYATCSNAITRVYNSDSGAVVSITNMQAFPVLEPPTTGVNIVSSYDGTTYSWGTPESGFLYNSASYTYAIYPGAYASTISDTNTHKSICLDCANAPGMAGLQITAAATINNYTVVRCPAGGIFADASCTIQNTIGYTDGNDIMIANGATVTGDYNCFGDSAKSGAGTYTDGGHTLWSSNPLFTSASDFTLQLGSPCARTGMDAGTEGDYIDPNGENTSYWGWSIGAYCYKPSNHYLMGSGNHP